MLNITLDTCVWLQLLQIDFQNEDNYLEEICYWIENGHLKHIVPTNIIDEWNRHKNGYQNEIVTYFKKKEKDNIYMFKHNSEMASTYKPEEIEKNVQKRIERIDLIFSLYSEKAPYDDLILIESGIRNLKKVAPNHAGDSYRDTVNILSLMSYLKNKEYKNSIFTTLNYKDFCADSRHRFDLHDGLKTEFKSADLTYEYFGENEVFGTKFFNILRKELKHYDFQVYLKDKKDKEESALLTTKKSSLTTPILHPDSDYLENIRYIDLILMKKQPTSFEQDLIKSLVTRHESYKQYFLNNIGSNGLV
nr:PIN domain-containing protein [uncultured Flavobacterium sp.]